MHVKTGEFKTPLDLSRFIYISISQAAGLIGGKEGIFLSDNSKQRILMLKGRAATRNEGKFGALHTSVSLHKNCVFINEGSKSVSWKGFFFGRMTKILGIRNVLPE